MLDNPSKYWYSLIEINVCKIILPDSHAKVKWVFQIFPALK